LNMSNLLVVVFLLSTFLQCVIETVCLSILPLFEYEHGV
jgi:hypothetical protein